MKFIYRFLPVSLAILMVLGSWLVSMGQADKLANYCRSGKLSAGDNESTGQQSDQSGEGGKPHTGQRLRAEYGGYA